jgi:hypothetical protein
MNRLQKLQSRIKNVLDICNHGVAPFAGVRCLGCHTRVLACCMRSELAIDQRRKKLTAPRIEAGQHRLQSDSREPTWWQHSKDTVVACALSIIVAVGRTVGYCIPLCSTHQPLNTALAAWAVA